MEARTRQFSSYGAAACTTSRRGYSATLEPPILTSNLYSPAISTVDENSTAPSGLIDRLKAARPSGGFSKSIVTTMSSPSLPGRTLPNWSLNCTNARTREPATKGEGYFSNTTDVRWLGAPGSTEKVRGKPEMADPSKEATIMNFPGEVGTCSNVCMREPVVAPAPAAVSMERGTLKVEPIPITSTRTSSSGSETRRPDLSTVSTVTFKGVPAKIVSFSFTEHVARKEPTPVEGEEGEVGRGATVMSFASNSTPPTATWIECRPAICGTKTCSQHPTSASDGWAMVRTGDRS
mmetsp:Transcript_44725/g.72809  ORF Transcript_44725/g.72809 Transcript_44725/m.72809 type:complete len:292 (-) Transcript_44725:2833-3708(-)